MPQSANGADLRSLIEFRLGLPWFMRPFTWVNGITLPHPLKPGRIIIWCRHWEAGTTSGRSLIVHEYVHAMQIAEAGKGLLYFHPFIFTYLSGWMRYGYRKHPFELAAYGFEAEVLPVLEALETDPEFRPERVPPECLMQSGGYFGSVWWPGLVVAIPLNALLSIIYLIALVVHFPVGIMVSLLKHNPG